MNRALLLSWKECPVRILSEVPLSSYTTFRLGGPCRFFITCQTPEELETVVTHLLRNGEKFILIGGGSNLVVADQGLDCAVIRYYSGEPIVRIDGTDLIVSGSTLLDQAVVFALKQSLAGLNYASGIPGTVGGAVVGNAGAFGRQVGDTLKSVRVITPSGEIKKRSASQLGFSYRHSALKESAEIVVSARFGLSPGDQEQLRKERDQILQTRHEKHPNLQTHPCAGSFFRNIEPTSKAERRQAAGWFLEQAGAKNFRSGGAMIFDKHANIIVKTDDCTAQNVYDLHLLMAKAVKEKFDLDLVREVRFVGTLEGVSQKNIVW